MLFIWFSIGYKEAAMEMDIGLDCFANKPY
jgi:hypothetical protein